MPGDGMTLLEQHATTGQQPGTDDRRQTIADSCGGGTRYVRVCFTCLTSMPDSYELIDERESAEQPAPVINLALARCLRGWMRCTCCGGAGGTDADVFGEVVITCDACLGTGVVPRPLELDADAGENWCWG
jgi:hypothetical protein